MKEFAPMFEWSISAGNVLTIVGMVGAVWGYKSYLDKTIAVLTLKMTLVDIQFSKVDNRLDKLSDGLSLLAKQDGRMSNYEQIITNAFSRITELERRFNAAADARNHSASAHE